MLLILCQYDLGIWTSFVSFEIVLDIVVGSRFCKWLGRNETRWIVGDGLVSRMCFLFQALSLRVFLASEQVSIWHGRFMRIVG